MSVESQTISPETEFCRIINKRAQHSFLPRYFSDSLFRCQGQGRGISIGSCQKIPTETFLQKKFLRKRLQRPFGFLPRRNVPPKKVPTKKVPGNIGPGPKGSCQKVPVNKTPG
jgi:hypothetical protein